MLFCVSHILSLLCENEIFFLTIISNFMVCSCY